MNDLTTIDRFGPDPLPFSATAIDAARARLDDAIAETPDSNVPRSRGRFLLLAAAAAAVAASFVVAPVLVGNDSSIALATVDPMSFPWTPSAVPAGLGEPVFEKDNTNFVLARYGTPLNGISIVTEVNDEDFWTIPADAGTVDVRGDEGTLYERPVVNGSPESARAVTVVWKDDSHDWTAITGSGQYAQADLVVAFAEGMRDVPQRVVLPVSIAPAGWEVVSYTEDRILTLSESGEPGPNDLTIVLTDRVRVDLSAYGIQDESTVTINGRPAHIGRQGSEVGLGGWILEATTASDQSFSVQAPGVFTRNQVLEIARTVTYEP